jgi:membrane-bound metal-dependent hydrolase YbcI (DUF457 family)
MFLGHYGVALAAKKASRHTSLGTLLMAAEFLDLLWPVFLLLGLERVEIEPGNTVVTPLNFVSYPLSHSLLAAVGWAFLFAGVYWLIRRNSGGALVLLVLVLSHWFLDVIVHRPDLPLYPGSNRSYGWGLWNSRLDTVLIEGVIYLMGVWVYQRATRPRDAIGRYAFRTLIFFLALIYLMNLLGPPPPSARYVAVLGLSQWLIVLWAYWVDKHREAVY